MTLQNTQSNQGACNIFDAVSLYLENFPRTYSSQELYHWSTRSPFSTISFHLTMKELSYCPYLAVLLKYISIHIAITIWFQSSKEKRLSSSVGSSFVCLWKRLLLGLASLLCKSSLAFLSTLLAAGIGEEGCEILSRWTCAPPV